MRILNNFIADSDALRADDVIGRVEIPLSMLNRTPGHINRLALSMKLPGKKENRRGRPDADIKSQTGNPAQGHLVQVLPSDEVNDISGDGLHGNNSGSVRDEDTLPDDQRMVGETKVAERSRMANELRANLSEVAVFGGKKECTVWLEVGMHWYIYSPIIYEGINVARRIVANSECSTSAMP